MSVNIFNSVKGLHPKRNKFTADTYRNDFTAPLGVNIPCFWAELPPATRFKVSASALVRLQALIAPVMDNIDYYVHFWKLPYRLIENDRFTQFLSGEIEPAEYDALFATPYQLAQAVEGVIPAEPNPGSVESKINCYNKIFGNGSLLDFLGYDQGLFPTISHDAASGTFVLSGGNNTTKLNWRGLIAYYMIHQNWYMNENVEYFNNFLQLVEDLVKKQSLLSLATLLYSTTHMTKNYVCMLPHGWDKDYFTSALPNVQFGEPVSLPIAGSAPVSLQYLSADNIQISDPVAVLSPTSTPLTHFEESNLKLFNFGDTDTITPSLTDGQDHAISALQGHFGPRTSGQPVGSGTADLSEATAITINELRFANALQVFKERQMRFGRRRLEYYKGFFDVEPEDLRLQVPKYLGGGRIPINISDIEQTSSTEGSQALGRLAGKATAVAGGFAGFSTFCSEETYIIGIAFAMPHVTYSQQVSRFRLKTNDPYDYFNPSFEHLGEQSILNIEVFAGSNNPSGEFGYTPRFTEYRFHNNEMHGSFKDSLSFWTLGRIFDSQPALNADFVYMQPKVFDRIFAVDGQPNMLVSMLFHTRAIKPVSKYGTPMLLA